MVGQLNGKVRLGDVDVLLAACAAAAGAQEMTEDNELLHEGRYRAARALNWHGRRRLVELGAVPMFAFEQVLIG